MQLFYRKYGSGPPLIILHGLYGSSDNWISIARSLEKRFTILLPDLRNHGQSPHNQIHNYDSMAEDLFGLVTELRLGKFFLAGHSMGGKAAMKFAMTWPEMLDGMLIADISPFDDKSRNKEEFNQHLQILNFILASNISEIKSRSELEAILLPVIRSEKVRGLILKNIKREPDNSFSWKINASALLENIDNIMDGIDITDTDKNGITGFPVFFLKGENSEYLPEKDYIPIRILFPAAEFILIRGAGHWIHSDNAEAVRNCLLRFL